MGACQRAALERRLAAIASFGAAWSPVRQRRLDASYRPGFGSGILFATARKTAEVLKLALSPFSAGSGFNRSRGQRRWFACFLANTSDDQPVIAVVAYRHFKFAHQAVHSSAASLMSKPCPGSQPFWQLEPVNAKKDRRLQPTLGWAAGSTSLNSTQRDQITSKCDAGGRPSDPRPRGRRVPMCSEAPSASRENSG